MRKQKTRSETHYCFFCGDRRAISKLRIMEFESPFSIDKKKLFVCKRHGSVIVNQYYAV